MRLRPLHWPCCKIGNRIVFKIETPQRTPHVDGLGKESKLLLQRGLSNLSPSLLAEFHHIMRAKVLNLDPLEGSRGKSERVKLTSSKRTGAANLCNEPVNHLVDGRQARVWSLGP